MILSKFLIKYCKGFVVKIYDIVVLEAVKKNPHFPLLKFKARLNNSDGTQNKTLTVRCSNLKSAEDRSIL